MIEISIFSCREELSKQDLLDIHTTIGLIDLSKTRFPYMCNQKIDDVLDIYSCLYAFIIRTKRDDIAIATRTRKTTMMNDFERAKFEGKVLLLVEYNLGRKLHELEQIAKQTVLMRPAPTIVQLSLT